MIGVKFHKIASLKLVLSDAVYIKLSFNSSVTLNMTKSAPVNGTMFDCGWCGGHVDTVTPQDLNLGQIFC